VWLEGLGKRKTFNDLFENRTCDLPACYIVPQPTTVLHAPLEFLLDKENDKHKNTGMGKQKNTNLKIYWEDGSNAVFSSSQ
jgi:hypothetical protein